MLLRIPEHLFTIELTDKKDVVELLTFNNRVRFFFSFSFLRQDSALPRLMGFDFPKPKETDVS